MYHLTTKSAVLQVTVALRRSGRPCAAYTVSVTSLSISLYVCTLLRSAATETIDHRLIVSLDRFSVTENATFFASILFPSRALSG
jgi:hypothetical protein